MFAADAGAAVDVMSSSVCHAPMPARMEAFTTRICLRAVDQYEKLLQSHFNKVNIMYLPRNHNCILVLVRNNMGVPGATSEC